MPSKKNRRRPPVASDSPTKRGDPQGNLRAEKSDAVSGAKPNDGMSVAEAGMGEQPRAAGCCDFPRAGWKIWVLSIALVAHLFAIFISLLAVISPASVVIGPLRTVEPYVKATHFGPGDSPTYLVGSETEEQPLRLQVSPSNDPSDEDWTELPVPGVSGLAASDRYQRWLAFTTALSQGDQASLAAELLSPVVARDKNIRCVRIVRKPTLLLNELQENAAPPYFARVVHLDDGTASLIADQEMRLSAVAISSLDEVNESEDDQ